MNTLPIHKRPGVSVLAGAMLAIAGCGGGGAGNGTGTGTLSLQITDGPVDSAEHVYIQFSGLELQAAGGSRTTLYYCQDPADVTKTILSETACATPSAPKQLDLMMLTGGQVDLLLQDFVLPAGRYNWIRLMADTDGVLDSYIVVSGTNYELAIPSNDQTGLKLNRGFVIPAGGSADFTIDFDLRKSVHVTGTGQYMLRPTLRLADNTMTGSIAGAVNDTLMTVTCDPVNDHPAVYVYSGAGATPDDIDGIDADPVTTASVKPDPDDNTKYVYKAAFLEAGDYTVAFTCDAAGDDPTVDNTLNAPMVSFSGVATVSVTAKTETTHNF